MTSTGPRKIMLSSAVGAFIGSLVALELAGIFWWVGLIVGGLTGYLSYEWRAVVRAIPLAHRAARGWSPSWQFRKVLEFLGWGILTIFTFAFLFGGIAFVVNFASRNAGIFDAVLYMSTLGLGAGVFMVLSEILFEDMKTYGVEDRTQKLKELNYVLFPPLLLFWHLPRGAWWLFKILLFLSPFLWKFLKSLVILIHSDARLTCAMDAMLGAVIGYNAGNAIIGAIAGGAFGFISHKLAARHLLKL